VPLRVTGTHKVGGLGFPATGCPIDITAITITQFANGKTDPRLEQLGRTGMMQQLDMAPGPVSMDQLLEKRD
jgi:hypothetical protein